MRIAIAEGVVPFSERADAAPPQRLADALRSSGHQVELIRLPVEDDPLRSALATRLTDVSDVGEVLVALGPPAHLLAHPRKVIWWAAERGVGGSSAKLIAADRAAFAEARRVIAATAEARSRILERWDGEVVLTSGQIVDEVLA